jgi:hypothetical protein
MAAVIEKSNMSGFPSGIPGDAYAGITEDGGSPSQLLIPSVYQGSTWAIDLKFKIKELLMSEEYEFLPVTSVTPLTAVTGITQTQIGNDTVRLSGTLLNVFPDEYYNFLMRDLQIRTLPAINSEDYLAVVEYHAPATKHVEKTYSFNVVWGPGIEALAGNANFTITQNVYWNYSVSIGTFTAVLATGEI